MADLGQQVLHLSNLLVVCAGARGATSCLTPWQIVSIVSRILGTRCLWIEDIPVVGGSRGHIAVVGPHLVSLWLV